MRSAGRKWWSQCAKMWNALLEFLKEGECYGYYKLISYSTYSLILIVTYTFWQISIVKNWNKDVFTTISWQDMEDMLRVA